MAAQRNGALAEEIVATPGLGPDGTSIAADHDQCPRPETSLEKISSLPPVYRPDGRITAATASGQADGAAVCLVMSSDRARELGMRPLARIHTIASGACRPDDIIYSAIPATRRALERSGLGLDEMSVIEVNEAFACAPLAFMREFGLPDSAAERINANGGACAIGHPVGASGARLVGTAAMELRRRGGRFALATICGGMGQGAATILERVA